MQADESLALVVNLAREAKTEKCAEQYWNENRL